MSYRHSDLWKMIQSCPWVPPDGKVKTHQPLVDLVELALNEWPLEVVDRCLDEYFDDVLEVYAWQEIQSADHVNHSRRGSATLPKAPKTVRKPKGSEQRLYAEMAADGD